MALNPLVKPYDVKDPGVDILPITPDDDNDLDGITRAILVGTDGMIKVKTRTGEIRTFFAPVGLIPLQVARVYATGTTAFNLSAVY